MNPLKGLLASRKFLLLIMDTVLSTFVLVGGWFLAPDEMAKAIAVIGIYQPVFLFVIGSITAEDNAQRKLQASINESESWSSAEIKQKVKTALKELQEPGE